MHFLCQGNPILGVHLYLYSNDITELPCPQDFSDAPREGALCHAISGADGKFMFRSLPCGKLITCLTNKRSSQCDGIIMSNFFVNFAGDFLLRCILVMSSSASIH